MRHELAARILVGVVGAAVVLPCVWFGGAPFVALVALAVATGLYEFATLMRRNERAPLHLTGIAAGALLLAGAVVPASEIWILVALTILAIGGAVEVMWRPPTARNLEDFALTLLGVLCVGWPATFALRLRLLPGDGLWWLLLGVLATWSFDTGAYFTGRAFGRHPFLQRISPKKTWEGVVGGLLASVVVACAVARFSGFLSVAEVLPLGLLVGAATQTGDLFESFYKRAFQVKDSSSLLPGHGGVLDRIDGLLFSLTVTYFYAMLVVSISSTT